MGSNPFWSCILFFICFLQDIGNFHTMRILAWLFYKNLVKMRLQWKWTAASKNILTQYGLQSNCRMCNQDVEKNCYYVREYLGDTSSYDAHLFFCFHDFRREFYMIWDRICLLIDMFELWNKFFLRIISCFQYLCKVEW